MQVITSPWQDTFHELVKGANHSIQLVAPYVKKATVEAFLPHIKPDVKLELITTFTVKNFHSGSCDLEALSSLLNAKATVSSFDNLHAKIYLFDQQRAVITSANLTPSGHFKNYECGLLFEDKSIAQKIASDFQSLKARKCISPITTQRIEVERVLLSRLPPRKKEDLSEGSSEVLNIPAHIIAEAAKLSGWNLEVFTRITALPSNTFSLSDLNRFLPELQARYPDNHTIKDTFRKIVQQLRDFGLLKSVKRGHYERLWVGEEG